MKNHHIKFHVMQIFIFLIVGVVIIGSVVALASTSFNDHTYTITVSDKERVYYKSTSKYIIYTKTNNSDERVFEDTDNLLRFKFNSSDIYAQLEKGKTYKVDVVGYRIPFVSWYENIIKIERNN